MNETQRYIYPAVLTYHEDQQIAVVFPDLDVATCGVDDADALVSARELLELTINGMEEDGDPIPQPTPLNDIVLEANQRALLVDVYMPSIRLSNVNKSINRTVTPKERSFNFSQILQDALKEKLKDETA